MSNRNPFQDSGGNNPFADSSVSGGAANDDPFAGPAAPPRSSEVPEYVTQLADRSKTVIAYGSLALGMSIFGVVVAVFGFASTRGGMPALPVSCLSLAIAMPAWLFGRADLRAMSVGAMENTNLARVRLGFRLATVAIVLSVIPIILLIVVFFLSA